MFFRMASCRALLCLALVSPAVVVSQKLLCTMMVCRSNTAEDTCEANAACRWNEMGQSGCLSPMADLIGAFADTLHCGGLSPQSACDRNTDCTWSESECKPNPAALMSSLMSDEQQNSNNVMAIFNKKEAACANLQSAACGESADCQWDAAESKCDKNSGAIMASLPPEQRQLTMRAGGCSSSTPQSDCSQNADCAWKQDDDSGNMECSVGQALMLEMMGCDPSALNGSASSSSMIGASAGLLTVSLSTLSIVLAAEKLGRA